MTLWRHGNGEWMGQSRDGSDGYLKTVSLGRQLTTILWDGYIKTKE